MARKQQLGIELQLSLDSKFGDLVKQIENAFSKVDLKGFEAKIAGTEAKVSKLAESISKMTGQSLKDVQKLMTDSTENKAMVNMTKQMQDFGKVTVDATGKVVSSLKKAQEEAKKAQADALKASREFSNYIGKLNITGTSSNGLKNSLQDTQREARESFRKIVEDAKRSKKEFNDALAAHNKGDKTFASELNQTQRDAKASFQKIVADAKKASKDFWDATKSHNTSNNSFLDELRQIRQSNKAELDKIVNDKKRAIADYNALGGGLTQGMKTQGFTQVNGGYVTNSAANYAANNTMDQMQVAAQKYNQSLKGIAEQTRQADDYLAALAKQGKAHWNGQVVSIEQYRKNMQALNKETKQTTGVFDLFGISLGRMSIALTAFYAIRGVLFTIRNQIRDAVGTLLDFNQALYDTAAISGSSVSSLKEMEQAAFNLATSSRFSVTQIMEITKILAQAGVASKDLAEATKITTMFATGANATPAQAVDLMTTAMNVWDIQATDSIRIANTLTATLNASKLEAGGLSTAFNYLANQGAQMNMSLEETSGIIATLSNVGVKPSTIGTGASGLLAAFAAPAPRFTALLKEFKVGLEEVNPMTHTFAEIIGRLEKAAIPTEAILGSLDKRIARTLVSALNAGQQGFELMTRAVTGTDAALIANFKVMDGARAKMNVVKAEFIQAMKEIGNAANGAFSAGLTVVRTFILSITTEGGKAAIQLGLVAAALTTVHAAIRATAIETSVLSKAILALKAVNPEVWVLVGALTAVTAALAYFGNQNVKHKEQSEAFSKAIANEADKLQQAEVGIIGVLNSMDKSHKTKNGYIKLTSDQTKELVKLINTYPEHLSNLDLENLKVEDLVKATTRLYEARKKNAAQVASEFNRHGANINTREGYLKNDGDFKKVLEFAKNKGMAVDDSDPTKVLRDVEAYFKNSNSLVDRNSYMKNIIERLMGKSIFGKGKLIGDVEEVEKSRAFQDANTTALGGHYLIRNRLAVAAPEVATTRDKSGASDWQPPASHRMMAAEQKQENLDEKAQSDLNELKRKIAKLSTEEKKIRLDQLKEDLKTTKELEEYKLLGEQVILEEAEQKRIAARIEILNGLANSLKTKVSLGEDGSLIGADGLDSRFGIDSIIADKTIKPETVKKLKDAAVEALDQALSNVNDTQGVDISKLINTKLPNAPHVFSDRTYNSDKAEKSADRLLQITTQRLNLEKEMAATADEVRQIEVRTIDAQILNTQQKAESYRMELASIENANILDADMQVTVARYEVIQEKLEEITALEAEWTRQKQEQENVGFWHNFEMGAKRAVVALGDFKSATQTVGEAVTGTALNGLVDLLDQSIEKIAKMEWSWKSFRETLGKILGDIGKELTKYYAKLIVIYGVQQLIGFVANSGKGGVPSIENINGNQLATGTQFTANKGGLITNTGVLRYAEGGQVPLNLGESGKDSVAAWLTPGEIVISKPAVDYYGADYFLKHNAKKFAEGGLVGGSSKGSSGNGSGDLTIINLLDVDSLPPQPVDANQVINIITFDANKRGPTYKVFKGIMQGA